MIQLPSNIQKSIIKNRRHLFERLGSERYSRPSRRGVGRKLEQYLKNDGFFIEVGANDGFSESNTYYFERFRNWKGILIEAIPELYQQCLQERPKSTVFNYALVADDYKEDTVEMIYGHLMSVVKGAFNDSKQEEDHAMVAGRHMGFTPYKLKVPARTLTSILDEMKVEQIDFFSLDVEGYELNVLRGLDLNRYKPQQMLVECLTEENLAEISSYLNQYYEEPEPLSSVDYLFRRR